MHIPRYFFYEEEKMNINKAAVSKEERKNMHNGRI
jgi:hypothetical protein